MTNAEEGLIVGTLTVGILLGVTFGPDILRSVAQWLTRRFQ